MNSASVGYEELSGSLVLSTEAEIRLIPHILRKPNSLIANLQATIFRQYFCLKVRPNKNKADFCVFLCKLAFIFSSHIKKIQLQVYYQCCVLIGWATTRLHVIAHIAH